MIQTVLPQGKQQPFGHDNARGPNPGDGDTRRTFYLSRQAAEREAKKEKPQERCEESLPPHDAGQAGRGGKSRCPPHFGPDRQEGGIKGRPK
ncbi:MAG: hypothetical protein H5U01_01200, partial [Clostridia bacterium]|nr:hypothetical protein [Clostridia bacterium]